MGVKSVQQYVNLKAGLLYETLHTEPLKMGACVGKAVNVEHAEMNTLIIEGEYYEIIGWYNGLAHIKKMEQEPKRIQGRVLTIQLYYPPDVEDREEDIKEEIARSIEKLGHVVGDIFWDNDENNVYNEDGELVGEEE